MDKKQCSKKISKFEKKFFIKISNLVCKPFVTVSLVVIELLNFVTYVCTCRLKYIRIVLEL